MSGPWAGGGGGAPSVGAANTVQLADGAGAFLAATGVTWAGTGRLSLAGGTVTSDAPLLNLTQTWNNAGVAFTGLRLNVTNTASAAASQILALQTNGVNRFSVNTDGWITAGASNSVIAARSVGQGFRFANDAVSLGDFGVMLQSTSANTGIAWSVDTNNPSVVLALRRDADNILAQRNGTAAQTFRVYNTFTDASNGEWGAMRWNSNTLEIGTFANGTGTARNLLFVASAYCFDGTTSSNPSLRTTGSQLRARLADNSDWAAFACGVLNTTGGIYVSGVSGGGPHLWGFGGTLRVDNGGGQILLNGRVSIPAGTAAAGTAPLKLTSGTNLTTPENGAFEFDGTNLYFTVGGTRRTVNLI